MLVIVGCLASLGWLLATGGDSDADDGGSETSNAEAQAQREELMSQTTRFVGAVNTYGPELLDEQNRMSAYREAVSELLSAKFNAGFEESVTIAEAQVAQTGYGRSAQVYAVGVARMDDDTATVLVGFVRTDSYPRPGKPSQRVDQPGNAERWAVSLVHTGGEWLVDNYAVITESPEAEGDPSQQPSEPAGSESGQQ